MIDLRPDHLETVRDILARYAPDVEVRAFGSRVTWTAKDHSDLDLVLVGEGEIDPKVLHQVQEAFADSDLPFRVDVVDWARISEGLRQIVEQQYEVIQRVGKKEGVANDGWKTMPFDEAVQVNPPVSLKQGLVYPFVDMQSVDPGSRSVGPSEMREFKGGGSRFAVGDTLMARITPCLENGKIARFVMDDPGQVGHGSTEFIVIRGRRGVTDNNYAYYLIRWDGVRQYAISQMTGSSGRQRVPVAALSHLRIPIPPLDQQRAVAHILGTLDDKIELNRRMNETLEAMARAVFKSWFVDFDPVRAKMEGRDPLPAPQSEAARQAGGLPPHLAALFPDRFEESELGEIPAGWSVGSILETAELLSGGTPKTSVPEYWDGGIPWVSAKDVSNAQGLFLLETERTISQAGVENSNTKILPEHTTIVTARGTVGSYCLLGQEMAMNQTNYGLKAKGFGDYFVFFSLAAMVEHLKQQAYGTIFDTITTKTFRDTQTILPLPSIVSLFERSVEPLMTAILNNARQSRTLTALRDALLPKLLSGEIRVREAEHFLEARGL